MRYFSQLPAQAQAHFLAYRETLLDCHRRPDVEACLVEWARMHEKLRWFDESFENAFGADDAAAGRSVVDSIISDRGGRVPERFVARQH